MEDAGDRARERREGREGAAWIRSRRTAPRSGGGTALLDLALLRTAWAHPPSVLHHGVCSVHLGVPSQICCAGRVRRACLPAPSPSQRSPAPPTDVEQSHDRSHPALKAYSSAPDRSCNLNLRRGTQAAGTSSCSRGSTTHCHWLGSRAAGRRCSFKDPFASSRKKAKKACNFCVQIHAAHYWALQAVSAGKEPGSQQVSPVATVATS